LYDIPSYRRNGPLCANPTHVILRLKKPKIAMDIRGSGNSESIKERQDIRWLKEPIAISHSDDCPRQQDPVNSFTKSLKNERERFS
jgi:hypothetical protein